MRCSSRRVSFSTNAVDMAAGKVVKVSDHPHPDVGKNLLINSTYFGGTAHGAWATMVEASLTEDKYAPPPITARPRIPGVQSAVVVGPKGEEIYTDEYGRVRVQFQWDREGKGVSDGEASSTWMRVAQAWAGKRWGMMVGGRVYNKIQPVPYQLPKHKQKSLWKSDSSPHKDNHYSEIRLDDRKDFELMYIQAQRDRQELVRRHETERTGENRVAVVGKNRSAIVREHDGTLVGKEFSVQMVRKPSVRDMEILADDDKGIPPQKKPQLRPKPTKIDMMDKKLMTTTGEATLEMDDDEIIFESKGEMSFRADGNVIVEGGSFIKINCSGG
jgi:type VI secretion system secreted protein VgrG